MPLYCDIAATNESLSKNILEEWKDNLPIGGRRNAIQENGVPGFPRRCAADPH
jgi:hypothetical protein